MNFYQYLLAIQEGKVINFKRFLTLLPDSHKQRWRDIFRPSNTNGKDIYNVTIIDQACFDQLLEESAPSTTRTEAAVKGNSHQHNSSMSFVLVFPEAFNQQRWQKKPKCPEVVVCDNAGLTLTFKPKKTLVVIENQENFFRYQEFLADVLKETLPNVSHSLESIDIAFGHGNSITNKLHADFFNQYQQVLCCFDYDLGGLTMFSTLRKLFKSQKVNATVSFIQPNKNQLHSDTFLTTHFKKSPEKVNSWQQAIQLAEQLGFTDLAQAFLQTKKFMEQEVYLSDLKKPSKYSLKKPKLILGS
jgi:hypothetical protein